MGKTRDLFKKIRHTRGTFHAKMGTIKDRSCLDLKEAKDIKKRWQEYAEELYIKKSYYLKFRDPSSNKGNNEVFFFFNKHSEQWIFLKSSPIYRKATSSSIEAHIGSESIQVDFPCLMDQHIILLEKFLPCSGNPLLTPLQPLHSTAGCLFWSWGIRSLILVWGCMTKTGQREPSLRLLSWKLGKRRRIGLEKRL